MDRSSSYNNGGSSGRRDEERSRFHGHDRRSDPSRDRASYDDRHRARECSGQRNIASSGESSGYRGNGQSSGYRGNGESSGYRSNGNGQSSARYSSPQSNGEQNNRFSGSQSTGYSSGRNDSRDRSQSRPTGRGGYQNGGGFRPEKRGRDQGGFRGGRGGRGRGGRGGKFGKGNHGGRKEPEVKPEYRDEFKTRTKDLVSKHVNPVTDDQKVELVANFAKISKKNNIVKQYHVSFSPDIEERNRGLKFKILKQVENELGTNYVFDAGSTLYSTTHFENVRFETNIENRPYNVILKFQLNVDSLKGDWLTYLNTILRDGLGVSPNFDVIDKKYYLKNLPNDLPPEHRMEIRSGYQAGIRKYEEDVLMCLKPSSRILNQTNVNDYLQNRGDENRLRGAVVITRYNNQTYKISRVERNENPRKKFKKNGVDITYIEYYRTQYCITIRNSNQPLLKAKPTAKNIRGGKDKEIDLIPELCFITGLNDIQRQNIRLMQDVAGKTKRNPQETVTFLNNFFQNIEGESTALLAKNDLHIEPNLLKITDARQVMNEVLIMRDKNDHEKSFQALNGDWSNEVTALKLHQSMKLKNWYFICPSACQSVAKRFLEKFKKVCVGFGMTYDEPELFWINGTGSKKSDYERDIEEAMQKNASFIMLINPGKEPRFTDTYTYFKKETLVKHPIKIPTQVVTKEVMGKPGDSVASKIAIQVNCKLGGVPWLIDLQYDGLLVMGIDISKTKGSNEIHSAAVALLNPMHFDEKNGIRTRTGGSYFCGSGSHQRGDIHNEVPNYFRSSLTKYENTYKTKPSKIIIYRDGVNDGDIEMVKSQEIEKIKDVISRRDKDWRPEFAFVLVNKRSNARFFKEGKDKSYGNPNPGTIVDSTVTLPHRFDFYLISQKQDESKTVCPVYYNVIDDNLFKGAADQAEKIQDLTYKLTHNYFNWDGGVRVPSVCQYAKKLARFSAEHISGFDSYDLEDNFKRLMFL